MFKDNRFFIEGEGNIKYSYNNGHIATDPILASTNFLKALERIPNLIEKYQSDNERLSRDLPVLKEVMTITWKKEPELKDLKSQLDSLSRQINFSLDNKEQKDTLQTNIKIDLIPEHVKPNVQVYKSIKIG